MEEGGVLEGTNRARNNETLNLDKEVRWEQSGNRPSRGRPALALDRYTPGCHQRAPKCTPRRQPCLLRVAGGRSAWLSKAKPRSRLPAAHPVGAKSGLCHPLSFLLRGLRASDTSFSTDASRSAVLAQGDLSPPSASPGGDVR